MSSPVLECRGLCRSFWQGGSEIRVLHEVDFTLAAAEFVVVIGASGSGKSTFLQLLGGLDRASGGEVEVRGRLLSTMGERRRSEIRNQALGFVYQFHHLLPEFTALDNVAMPLLIRGRPPAQARQAAAAILQRLGMGERLKHRPGELSGGERQRTAIARAVVTNPACVLADEPTGNLDSGTATAVMEALLGLRSELGTALLLVTHDQQIAARADRVLLLADGQLQPA